MGRDILDIERGEIGYSRWTDPGVGTKYTRYLDKVKPGHHAYNGEPFCAAGQSWSFAQGGYKGPGMPTAACGDIRAAAKRQGLVVADRRSARPRDIVLFRWDGNIDDDSYSDHVGMVELNLGRSRGIQTVEYNTGNGRVMRRTRDWSVVQYIIRPGYGAGAAPTPVKPARQIITVDGLWGSNTTTSLQVQAGCPYVDGVISRQNPQHRGRLKGCTVGWEYVSPDGEAPGSYAIQALQKKLGVTADGIIGPATINALIAWGMRHGSGATKLDGRLDWASPTIRTFQRCLNEGTFF